MTPTDTTDESATSIAGRAKALRGLVVDRVDGVAESGKALLASRRDARRRDELLRELGEIHVAATNGQVDQAAIDRIVTEINTLDAPGNDGTGPEQETENDDR